MKNFEQLNRHGYLICRYTGEILGDFTFPHLRDQYVHDHKLHDVVTIAGVTELRLPRDEYDELTIQYHHWDARVRYHIR